MAANVENDSQLKQCRICLDDEHPDGIISPCLCSGNSAYVHRECLNNWRAINKNGKGFKSCDICQFEYIIETVNDNSQDEKRRLRKYYFFVIRDLSLMVLLFQLIIFGFTYLLKKIDQNTHQIQSIFPDSFHELLTYYLSAILFLLAIIGFITLIGLCIGDSRNGFRNISSFGNCGSNGKSTFVSFVVMVIIIGMFIVIYSNIMIIKKIMQHHTNKLWLRQEAEKYIVKDFQGCRKELEKYKTNNRTAANASIINIDEN